jgi:polar amino acid transport system substrate-binding protein
MDQHHFMGRSMRSIDRRFVAGALFAAAGVVCATDLQILTTEVPPMAFMKDGKLQGFCIEIVADIQRRLGKSDAITLLPWARAYQMALHEPNTMLICPKRTAEREHRFRWVGPLLSSQTAIYAQAGGQGKLASLEAAKALSSLLVLRASYSYQDLTGMGFRNLYEVNDPAGMVRMLMASRAPAMMMERQLLDVVLKDLGADPKVIVPIYEIQSPSSNLAFSTDVPQQTVNQWQAAFDAMKKDGSYGLLYDKWIRVRRH